MRNYITTGEAAKILECSQQTIIRSCDMNIFDNFKLPGSKFRRIKITSIFEFMKKNNIELDEDIEEYMIQTDIKIPYSILQE